MDIKWYIKDHFMSILSTYHFRIIIVDKSELSQS